MDDLTPPHWDGEPPMTATDTLADKLRTDLFAVLRSHEVSEQCFAEVAMITQAFKTRTAAPADVAGVVERLNRNADESPEIEICPELVREAATTITTQAARIAELEEALGQIAGKNDLSAAADDEVEAYARSALYECELIARAALAQETKT